MMNLWRMNKLTIGMYLISRHQASRLSKDLGSAPAGGDDSSNLDSLREIWFEMPFLPQATV